MSTIRGQGHQVGRLRGRNVRVVSIHDPGLQAALNREPAVRALLDSQEGRTALAPGGRGAPRLDQAAVRLSTPFGRDLSRACSLAIWDRIPQPDGIHHRSRHDDDEDCWALFDHAGVRLAEAAPFAPDSSENHRQALQEVAALWDIPLPPTWAGGAPRLTTRVTGEGAPKVGLPDAEKPPEKPSSL